jgi:adenylyltransferase/sulfurtransferase
MEALKVLAGIGQPLVGRLQLLDARSMDWRTLKLKKDPSCMVCSQGGKE